MRQIPIMLDVRDKPVFPKTEGLFKAAGLTDEDVRNMREKAEVKYAHLPEKLVEVVLNSLGHHH